MAALSDITTREPQTVASSHDSATALSWSLVNPLASPGWDEIAARFPESNFFHSAAWAAVLTDTFAFTPCYSVGRRGAEPDAVAPFMEAHSLVAGTRGVCLPFSDECPPLVSREAADLDLLPRLIELGGSRRWRYFQCRGGNRLAGAAPVSLSFFRHTLDLTDGADRLFRKFDDATRRAIRKAESSKLRVGIDDSPEVVATFYRLYCLTRKKHGLPPQPFIFFQNIHRHVLSQKRGFVALASLDSQPVAAAMFFLWGRQALFKYGASDPVWQGLRGNNLVMWAAIKWLIDNRREFLHFGRTSLANAGLRRFKLGWGCEESKLEYFRFNLRQLKFEHENDDVYGWHNRLFRRLPIPMARLIGRLAYKHTT